MAVLDAKLPARQASTKAVSPTKAETKTLEGKAPLVIDGGGLGSGARVLLKDQAKQEQNGLFEVTTNEAFAGTGIFAGSGNFAKGEAWVLTRTADADSSGEVTEGMLVSVEDGQTNQGTSWIQRTAGPIEVGVTAQTFESLPALPSGQIQEGQLEGAYAAPAIKEAVIDNGKVSSQAAIAYSKLNLASKVAASDLASSAKELSPQLATPGVKKTNSASVTVEWPGGAEESGAVEFEHGLGVEPKTVLCSAAYSATSTFVTPGYQLVGTTKVKVKGFCPPGIKPAAGTKAVISWEASG